MRQAVRGVIASYRKHHQILTAVMELARYTREIDEVYRRLIERNAGYSRDFLDRGQATGRIRELDSGETAHVIYSGPLGTCLPRPSLVPSRGRSGSEPLR
jgi:hypothetical protein